MIRRDVAGLAAGTGLALAVVLLGVTCLAPIATPAFALEEPKPIPDLPGSDDRRFTFHRSDDGYLRLDGRAGEVSLCLKRQSGWQCQVVPDERAALESEIGRLQTETATLKAELLARNIPLPGTLKPTTPDVRNGEPRITLPSDAELNRVMSYVEKIWKRLAEMVGTVQKEMTK